MINNEGLTGRYSRFLAKLSCFDLVPESGKLVVLDVTLSVKVAFQALRENGKNSFGFVIFIFCLEGIKSAPLWDTDEREFIGMISISDFVEILLRVFEDTMRLDADPVERDAFVVNQLQK